MPFLDVGGARFHYRLDGGERAPVLVLSSSLGTDLTLWDAQVPAFSKRFRVLRYDTRGHGQTAVTEGPYTLDRLGRDVIALLDALRVPRAHFCGISLGGMTGMWLGAQAADRIDRLVLCNTSSYMPTVEMWNARIAAVERDGMSAVAEPVIGRWFTDEFRASHPDTVARVRSVLLKTSPAGYVACSAAIRDMDQRKDLERIGAPALVIAGSRDPSTPPEMGRLVASTIRGARYRELDAAHLSNLQQAAAFNDAVLQFLG